ncbi:unnamed protein product [Dicrocoelium dendriticum]|nr:unnamed protein product [Dicrocoelium dendriticum]
MIICRSLSTLNRCYFLRQSVVKQYHDISLRRFHLGSCLFKPVHVKMPSLSPTMTEGSIVQWTKKEGEEVSSGDVLCEVQTDKAVVALECEEDGVLAKIIVAEKSPNVPIGERIAILASPGEDWREIASSVASSDGIKTADSQTTTDSATMKAHTEKPEAIDVHPTAKTSDQLGPAVRLLLESHSLDASKIPASGPRGQLLKGDVLSYIARHPQEARTIPPEQPSPPSSPVLPTTATLPTPAAPTGATGPVFTDISLTNMRQTIAKRLTESKSNIPHAYVRTTVDVDKVLELRSQLRRRIGLKLSLNDLIIKACAFALRLVPQLNSVTDSARKVLVPQSSVDICMAVATPAGLIAPILRNADRVPISQLSVMASSLAVKAREGKLQPNEFQGGSFTISNLGMFGIREFTAIINPPQVAILAVGGGVQKPVDVCDERIRFANKMTLTMSIDSRYVDEVTAGRFLTQVSRLLGDHPSFLLAGDPQVTADLSGSALCKPDNFDLTMLSMGLDSSLPVLTARSS